MYDICHPVYYQLCQFGCNDPVKTSTAFYVYIELCEVKRFWDVKCKYNKELDLFYLEVRKTNKQSTIELYIPWALKQNISLEHIEKIQQTLQNKRLTIVFKSEDSSSVCYTVTEGLVKPVTPELSKQLKEKEEKKSRLEEEIRRNTSNLHELAKSLAYENNGKNHLDCNASASTTVESVIIDCT